MKYNFLLILFLYGRKNNKKKKNINPGNNWKQKFVQKYPRFFIAAIPINEVSIEISILGISLNEQIFITS